MSLTVPTHISRALQGSCSLYVQATIVTRDTTGARTVHMVSQPGCGATDQDPAPAVLSTARPAGYYLDAVTRAAHVGQMSIEIADPGVGSWWRAVRSSCFLRQSRLTLRIGVVGEDVALANMLPIWSGVIDGCKPGYGYQTLTASGGLILTRNRELAGLWAWRHPAELAHEILNWCGIPDANIDTGSFAYNADTKISHYNVRRTETAWDGGEAYEVVANGAINDARVRKWRIAGITEATSDNGRLYPQLIVTFTGSALELTVKLFRDDAGVNLVGIGRLSIVQGFTVGSYGVGITVPDYSDTIAADGSIRAPNNPPQMEGITGSVEVYLASTTSFTIGLASTSYLTCDSAQYGEPMNALDAIQDVARAANCSVIEQEDGKIEWKRFDSTAAAVAHWGEHELGDTLDIVDVDGNMVNEVRITTEFARPSNRETQRESRTYIARREDAQDQYSVDGTTKAVFPLEWSRQFGNAVAALMDDIPAVDTSAFNIGAHASHRGLVRNYGMTGLAGDGSGDRVISIARYGYFEIEGTGRARSTREARGGEDSEFIEARISARGAVGNSVVVEDPQTELDVTRYHNFRLDLASCQRGQLGSTASAWSAGNIVYDLTQPVITAEAVLERFEHGAPVARCSTSLKQVAVQVGELVTIETALLSSIGLDGVTSAKKWEVCGKEIDVLGDSPGINWLLVMAESPRATSSTNPEVVSRLPEWRSGQIGSILDGLSSTTPVAPSQVAGAMADSGVSDWIYSGAVQDSAITSIKIDDGAVIEDKLGALAVTAGKIGAAAVTETKIGAGAVTATKIGPSAVTPAGITNDTRGDVLVQNADFGAATQPIATTAPDRWSVAGTHGVWGTDAKTTATRLSGNRAIEFAPTAEADVRVVSGTMAVEGGKTYRLAITGQGDSINAGDRVNYRVNWLDANKAYISADGLLHQFEGSVWESPEAVIATAPTNARYAIIVVGKLTT